ncbi:MAG TPA: heparan-alpha-glucosaminide N-acetyltransferase domain-containing protein [Candidatus Kryptonia bacterium]
MEKSNRLVLLDIIRAFGVVLMIEGHTVDAVLSPIYKDSSSLLFQLWTFCRGLTAPFFFFSAGLAFIVATVKSNGGMLAISRRSKFRRSRRIAILLFLGYALHMPLQILYNPSSVTADEWKVFSLVDALHVISLSLLVILIISLIARREKNLLRLLVAASVLSLVAAPLLEQVKWENFLQPVLYPYLTYRSGSYFTFFPFSAYLFAGAAFGAASISLPMHERGRMLSRNFLRASLASITLFVVAFPIQTLFVSPESEFWRVLPAINFLRFGLITLAAAAIGYISLSFGRFPKIMPAIGRSSLTVYVVHLMIVYGSPINLGLYQLIPEGTNPFIAILLACVVISLMVGMVYGIETYRSRKRRLAAIAVGETAE